MYCTIPVSILFDGVVGGMKLEKSLLKFLGGGKKINKLSYNFVSNIDHLIIKTSLRISKGYNKCVIKGLSCEMPKGSVRTNIS